MNMVKCQRKYYIRVLQVSIRFKMVITWTEWCYLELQCIVCKNRAKSDLET